MKAAWGEGAELGFDVGPVGGEAGEVPSRGVSVGCVGGAPVSELPVVTDMGEVAVAAGLCPSGLAAYC